MKIIAWNLNHRIQAKAIPPSAVEVIRQLAPDILVLTEYVDGDGRADFKRSLNDIGLVHVSVSDRRSRHNQVLIASRASHTAGGVPAPTESHGHTNFLSVSFDKPQFTLVGVRAPAYEKSAEVESYWKELTVNLEAASSRDVVVIGDLNGDPELTSSIGGRHIKRLREGGWTVPPPLGPWSYISMDGRCKSRIDHVLASPGITGMTASYITEVGGIVVAGPKEQGPISDHAILCCEIPWPARQPSS